MQLSHAAPRPPSFVHSLENAVTFWNSLTSVRSERLAAHRQERAEAALPITFAATSATSIAKCLSDDPAQAAQAYQHQLELM